MSVWRMDGKEEGEIVRFTAYERLFSSIINEQSYAGRRYKAVQHTASAVRSLHVSK